MAENGLRGPFALADNVIDREVYETSAGAFALDDSENGGGFTTVYVGRSDIDVNTQLHVFVGTYKRFKFTYCPSALAAFEEECRLYHEFEPRENAIHPLRPAGSDWRCPRCKLLS